MTPPTPHHDDTRQLLARRLRIGFWLVLLAITAFGLRDPVLHPDRARPLTQVFAVEILLLFLALWLARRTASARAAMAIGFAMASALCVTTALSGILLDDADTAPVLLLILTLGAAMLIPWGVWPQIALQAVATAAILWNVHAVRGVGSDPTLFIAVLVGAVVAVYGASDAARYRRERGRAEEAEVEVRARVHQAALAQAARLSTLGGLAAGLAHEINQPLAAIVSYSRGCAHRLRAGDLRPDDMLEVLESIAAQAQRAAAVLRRIRDFVRTRQVARDRIDLGVLVSRALRFAEVEARQLGIALRLEVAPAPILVEVDPVQIEQVILNLVRNGFDATAGRSGGPTDRREISVRTACTPSGAEITVSDTGPGMTPEVAARLFEPFFTTKRDGLGLGLSISRSIVEAHDGALWASPNTPHGTTFHLRLPERGVREVAA